MSKESLKLKLKEFEEMKFPSEPENLDVIAELDTTGDGITGNIEAFLAGNSSDIHPLHYFEYIKKQLSNYEPVNNEDAENYEYFKKYFNQIGELVGLLQDEINK